MQIRSVALALCVLVACGGNNGGNGNGDGGNGDGGSNSHDAYTACDYSEMNDGTNATSPESTGLTIGASTKTICGNVDTGHFASGGSGAEDVDTFGVTVAGTAELIVEFEDSAPSSLTDFNVTITDTMTNPTLLNSGDFTGATSDHGAYLAELPAGNFNIVVTATGPVEISAAIPYKVRIVADNPTMRCPDMTSMTADYTEANDGSANIGNDVLTVDFTKNPSFALTTSTSDNPETSGITLGSGNKHIVGSSAIPNPLYTDNYLDRDTFEFMTDASTNEVSIRLNWPGSTSDLDYLVFADGSITAPIAVSTLSANTEDEFQTFAVKPSTSYWLWVGAYTRSTGQPIAYSASLCGATFTP